MPEIDPALLANLDQSVASIDADVTRYARQLAAVIAGQGKEAAIANFFAWLRTQPADAVAGLATGALARLAVAE